MSRSFFISNKLNRINILVLFLILWGYKLVGRIFLPIQYYRVIDLIILVPILFLIILLLFKVFYSIYDYRDIENKIKELKKYSHNYDEIETERRIKELEIAMSM